MAERDAFGEEYWRQESDYRKFEDYAAGLRQTARWYRGFLRMIRRDLPAPGRHVDAGCGHGAIVQLLERRGFDSHGFDMSHWMVEQAHGTFGDRVRVGDVESGIPFDGEFRLITCLEVVEHLQHPETALRVFAERLEPGGRLIATTPNLRPRIPGWPDPTTTDPTHVNVHEPAWWARCLSAAGLRVVRVRTFVSLPLLWRVSPALSISMPMGATAGPGVLMIGERPG